MGVGDTDIKGERTRINVVKRDHAIGLGPWFFQAAFKVLRVLGKDVSVYEQGLGFDVNLDRLLLAPVSFEHVSVSANRPGWKWRRGDELQEPLGVVIGK